MYKCPSHDHHMIHYLPNRFLLPYSPILDSSRVMSYLKGGENQISHGPTLHTMWVSHDHCTSITWPLHAHHMSSQSYLLIAVILYLYTRFIQSEIILEEESHDHLMPITCPPNLTCWLLSSCTSTPDSSKVKSYLKRNRMRCQMAPACWRWSWRYWSTAKALTHWADTKQSCGRFCKKTEEIMQRIMILPRFYSIILRVPKKVGPDKCCALISILFWKKGLYI